MATIYSSYSPGWLPSGASATRKYRSWLTYTITTSATKVTVTWSAGINLTAAVSIDGNWRLDVSGTNQSTVTKKGNSTEYSGGTKTYTWATGTYTFARKTTAYTAKITSKISYTGSGAGAWNGTSRSVTASISVPVLAAVTISFNANGGSGSVSSISTYYGVSNTVPANGYTRTGYTFSSWNTKADGSGTSYAPGAKITPTASLTLYAQWQTTYVKPTIENLVAFRVVDTSGGSAPEVTSSGVTGFCKFDLVGGANYTVDSVKVQFGAASPVSMSKSGTMYYAYSVVGAISTGQLYTINVTLIVKGTDSVLRTYTDSTYISKEECILDISKDGNHVMFGGTATDGLVEKQYGFGGVVESLGYIVDLRCELTDTGAAIVVSGTGDGAELAQAIVDTFDYSTAKEILL